ncbi:hypothetical protein GCM10010324_55110 [Streptomyces hiroshimensis]|uniref:Uncharacterized protein n=1 Tax=Streptomyces hiroshimensis TaxID=66424 RepID=A0ABQ2Z0M5_9ACTN|nr:hypothetical protein GCM10010324_55110 [Streptomyces hiroshimensis]
MVGVQTVGECPDRIEIGQVEVAHFETGARLFGGDIGDRPAALFLVTYRKDHMCTPAGERPGGRQAEAAVGSGDDEHPPRLVRYLIGSPSLLLRHATYIAARVTECQDVTRCHSRHGVTIVR